MTNNNYKIRTYKFNGIFQDIYLISKRNKKDIEEFRLKCKNEYEIIDKTNNNMLNNLYVNFNIYDYIKTINSFFIHSSFELDDKILPIIEDVDYKYPNTSDSEEIIRVSYNKDARKDFINWTLIITTYESLK